MRRHCQSRWVISLIIAIPSFGLYACLSLLRFTRFRMTEDLTIFDQALRGYANFSPPISTIKAAEPFNLLGDHFTPAVALLTPLYWIWPDPRMLLLAQALLFASSIGVFADSALRLLARRQAVCVSVGLALSWGIASAVAFDFHETAIAMPLLTLSLAAYLRADWGGVACWSVPLILVKEDLCLVVATLGVLLFRQNRRLGLSLSALGVSSFFVITLLIIPKLSFSGRYTYWGGGSGSAALSERLLARATEALSSGTFWSTAALTVAPALGICFRSQLVWLLLPNFAVRFASEQSNSWGTSYHYSATLSVVVFVALLDVFSKFPARPRFRSVVSSGVLAVSLLLLPAFPYVQIVRGDLFRCSTCSDAKTAVASIPSGSSVVADSYLTSHLTNKATTFLLQSSLTDSVGRPISSDYAIVDLWRTWQDGSSGASSVRGLQARGYTLKSQHGRYLVLATSASGN